MDFDPNDRTKWLDSFDSLDDLRDWLLRFGVYHPAPELAKTWRFFLEQGRVYRVEVRGKRDARKRVYFVRQLPKCTTCGVRIPGESKPVNDWGPGVRPLFVCEDCADPGEG